MQTGKSCFWRYFKTGTYSSAFEAEATGLHRVEIPRSIRSCCTSSTRPSSSPVGNVQLCQVRIGNRSASGWFNGVMCWRISSSTSSWLGSAPRAWLARHRNEEQRTEREQAHHFSVSDFQNTTLYSSFSMPPNPLPSSVLPFPRSTRTEPVIAAAVATTVSGSTSQIPPGHELS